MVKLNFHDGKREHAENLSNSHQSVTYKTIEVKPVNRVIGVEVTGLDMTLPLSEAQIEDVNCALGNHNVLFFQDQPTLTAEQQMAFARNFGPLHIHPNAVKHEDYPELFVIHTHGKSVVNNGSDWHTDVSSDKEPPMGTILQIHRTPCPGGDTIFANMYAAYDALSNQMKTYLCSCTALHDPEIAHRGRFAEKGVVDTGKKFKIAIHPVIRTHPVSDRQALYVNEVFTSKIMDIPVEESEAILSYLFQHMARPEFQVRYQWRENSIAFWDNRCTQHLAMWDYWPEERYGHRVTIKGDRPFFRPN